MSHTLHTSLEEIILTVLEKDTFSSTLKNAKQRKKGIISWKKRSYARH